MNLGKIWAIVVGLSLSCGSVSWAKEAPVIARAENQTIVIIDAPAVGVQEAQKGMAAQEQMVKGMQNLMSALAMQPPKDPPPVKLIPPAPPKDGMIQDLKRVNSQIQEVDQEIVRTNKLITQGLMRIGDRDVLILQKTDLKDRQIDLQSMLGRLSADDAAQQRLDNATELVNVLAPRMKKMEPLLKEGLVTRELADRVQRTYNVAAAKMSVLDLEVKVQDAAKTGDTKLVQELLTQQAKAYKILQGCWHQDRQWVVGEIEKLEKKISITERAIGQQLATVQQLKVLKQQMIFLKSTQADLDNKLKGYVPPK